MTLGTSSLAKCFQELSVIISFDAEDQQIDELTRIFKLCLEAHDYNYSYSDDSYVYNKGLQEQSIIERATREHPELKALWTEFWKQKR